LDEPGRAPTATIAAASLGCLARGLVASLNVPLGFAHLRTENVNNLIVAEDEKVRLKANVCAVGIFGVDPYQNGVSQQQLRAFDGWFASPALLGWMGKDVLSGQGVFQVAQKPLLDGCLPVNGQRCPVPN